MRQAHRGELAAAPRLTGRRTGSPLRPPRQVGLFVANEQHLLQHLTVGIFDAGPG
ncbi:MULTISPECIES: hypothetical protein [unclassified Streptomyces]|uniref:hypothetical protein n=1 Tax=unclassified Streptomyces TaxID=2593676 RepID=UPI002E163CA5|nr:hypothetical protein OG457_08665 [Streptomyces sp. NBC_01207]WTA17297.1 hypothetical protein OG365_04090 [Streptomyces sp. NBC_00853]